MNIKTIVILRADGNSQMGLGHIHRLLALGEILRTHFICKFMVRDPLPGIRKLILENCDEIMQLGATDVKEELEILSNVLTGKEIVVLDGYHFSTDYQRRIKESGCCVVCIDDIHSFHFFADVIINPAGGVTSDMYSMEAHTLLFAGPGYALLKRPFRQASKRRDELLPNNCLLICMGGADPGNHTVSALRHCFEFSFQAFIVVVGEAYLHKEALLLESRKADRPVEILTNIGPDELANVMKRCSTAVCSASGIAYEYLSVGGELYVKKTVANQSQLFDYLIEERLAFPYEGIRVSREEVAAATAKQKEIFDGNADKRILKLFQKLDFDLNVAIRKAGKEDLITVFNWANDAELRRQSHNSDPITLEAHTAWFSKKLNDPFALLYIFEYKSTPFAIVRFDVHEEATISYSVDVNFRGRGWGQHVLQTGLSVFRREYGRPVKIVGYVKHENESSNAIFKKLGFKQYQAKEYINSYKYEYKP